jgi:hypothetical protein
MDLHFSAPRGLRPALPGYVIPVPCYKTPRWSLGALALVAVVVAGCGAASSQQNASLHANGEKRLLSLVTRARVDASKHNGTAVHAVLGEFVSEVRTLNTSGQLSGTTAGRLDRAARLTAAQAAQQLHPANAAAKANATQTATATTPDPATTTSTTPATTPTPGATPPGGTPAPPNQPSPPTNTPSQNGQGNNQGGSPSPGHGHGYGHRHGDAGAGWWAILSNWINSQSHGGGGGD